LTPFHKAAKLGHGAILDLYANIVLASLGATAIDTVDAKVHELGCLSPLFFGVELDQDHVLCHDARAARGCWWRYSTHSQLQWTGLFATAQAQVTSCKLWTRPLLRCRFLDRFLVLNGDLPLPPPISGVPDSKGVSPIRFAIESLNFDACRQLVRARVAGRFGRSHVY
jgi:hypothetical protein